MYVQMGEKEKKITHIAHSHCTVAKSLNIFPAIHHHQHWK